MNFFICSCIENAIILFKKILLNPALTLLYMHIKIQLKYTLNVNISELLIAFFLL